MRYSHATPMSAFLMGLRKLCSLMTDFTKGFRGTPNSFGIRVPGKFVERLHLPNFHSVKACERLVELSPDLKIIILVRNPIERTFSLYRHHLSKGRIRIPFSQALERHPELIDTGKYSIHAKRWEDSFPPLNTMYLWQDDIKQNPQKILDDTCDFIGVKKIKIPPVANEIVNTATAPRNAYVARILSATATTLRSLALHRVVNFGRSLGLKKMYEGGATVQKLSNEQYRMLADLFEEDLVWLEQRLGRKLDDWRYSMPC